MTGAALYLRKQRVVADATLKSAGDGLQQKAETQKATSTDMGRAPLHNHAGGPIFLRNRFGPELRFPSCG